MKRTCTRRHLVAMSVVLPALVATGAVAQNDQAGTPTAGTPAARPCLPATPAAADQCARGQIPATLRIDAIGVDAPVEILETVAGVMQQPSDEVHVAWYKESARLGELGNIWLAGHLNWWDAATAVFAHLGTLSEEDEVVLLDDRGGTYMYAVEWVRQESNLEPPRAEVMGTTDHEAVTLITCGGEWDNAISEYNERTVVRARRMPGDAS